MITKRTSILKNLCGKTFDIPVKHFKMTKTLGQKFWGYELVEDMAALHIQSIQFMEDDCAIIEILIPEHARFATQVGTFIANLENRIRTYYRLNTIVCRK